MAALIVAAVILLFAGREVHGQTPDDGGVQQIMTKMMQTMDDAGCSNALQACQPSSNIGDEGDFCNEFRRLYKCLTEDECKAGATTKEKVLDILKEFAKLSGTSCDLGGGSDPSDKDEDDKDDKDEKDDENEQPPTAVPPSRFTDHGCDNSTYQFCINAFLSPDAKTASNEYCEAYKNALRCMHYRCQMNFKNTSSLVDIVRQSMETLNLRCWSESEVSLPTLQVVNRTRVTGILESHPECTVALQCDTVYTNPTANRDLNLTITDGCSAYKAYLSCVKTDCDQLTQAQLKEIDDIVIDAYEMWDNKCKFRSTGAGAVLQASPLLLGLLTLLAGARQVGVV